MGSQQVQAPRGSEAQRSATRAGPGVTLATPSLTVTVAALTGNLGHRPAPHAPIDAGQPFIAGEVSKAGLARQKAMSIVLIKNKHFSFCLTAKDHGSHEANKTCTSVQVFFQKLVMQAAIS